MDDRVVWDRLIEIMREVFDDDALAVDRDSTAADVDGWDSLTNIELVVALEHEFGIRFRTGEIAAMHSVGALVDAISNRVNNGR